MLEIAWIIESSSYPSFFFRKTKRCKNHRPSSEGLTSRSPGKTSITWSPIGRDMICRNLFLNQIWESGMGSEMANKWKPCNARVRAFGQYLYMSSFSHCVFLATSAIHTGSCWISSPFECQRKPFGTECEKRHARQVALLWEVGCVSHWSSRSCHVSDFFPESSMACQSALALQGTLSQP